MKNYELFERTWKVNYNVIADSLKEAKDRINKIQGFKGTIASGHYSTAKETKTLS